MYSGYPWPTPTPLFPGLAGVRALELDVQPDPEGRLFAQSAGLRIAGKPGWLDNPTLQHPGFKVGQCEHGPSRCSMVPMHSSSCGCPQPPLSPPVVLLHLSTPLPSHLSPHHLHVLQVLHIPDFDYRSSCTTLKVPSQSFFFCCA
jgi:hypothetical protein